MRDSTARMRGWLRRIADSPSVHSSLQLTERTPPASRPRPESACIWIIVVLARITVPEQFLDRRQGSWLWPVSRRCEDGHGASIYAMSTPPPRRYCAFHSSAFSRASARVGQRPQFTFYQTFLLSCWPVPCITTRSPYNPFQRTANRGLISTDCLTAGIQHRPSIEQAA
jgi:hypothetical protein